MTKRSKLDEAVLWSRRLNEAVERRAEILGWTDPFDKSVRISVGSYSVLLREPCHREPKIFEATRAGLLAWVDAEISMIYNTLNILDVEIDG